MSNKPTHDILLVENYDNNNGEEKAAFTRIGSAWQKDTGTISCEVRDGLAVSGRFIITPRKEREQGKDA